MPPEKREPQPGGIGRGPQNINSVNSNNPEHSPGHAHPQGLIPIGVIAAEIVAGLHFRRQVERLHRLGPRAMAELLAEIGAERSIQTIIDRKLTRYTELDAEAIEAAGGDAFWPVPLHELQPNPEPPECSGNRALTRDSPA